MKPFIPTETIQNWNALKGLYDRIRQCRRSRLLFTRTDALAAYAIGSTKAFIYIRGEFRWIADILEQALANHKPDEIDWVTFIGSGETTLHASIGWLIREVKARTHLPVAVITNGSLLYLPEMRSELAAADGVLPSLDAGNSQLYRKINRPHPDIPFDRFVEGLVSFRNGYQGRLWVEVMLVRGLNDTEAALKEIAATLTNVRPDEIHIVQPDCPAVEPWVQPPDEEGLLRARAILGDVAKIIHPASGAFDISGHASLVDAVVGIITRHPMREDELIETLRHWLPGKMTATLQELGKSGKAQIVERYGIRFWSASPAYYPKGKAAEDNSE